MAHQQNEYGFIPDADSDSPYAVFMEPNSSAWPTVLMVLVVGAVATYVGWRWRRARRGPQ